MLGNFLKKFFGKIRAKTGSEAGFTLVSLGIGMVLTLAVLAPTVQWFLSLGTTLYHNQSAMNMETLALGEYNAISNESYMDAYSKQGETETTTSSDGKYRIKITYGEEEFVDGTDDMPLNSIPIEIRVEDISDSSKNFVLNHKIVSNTENSGIVHQVSSLLDRAGKLVVPCHQNETRNSAGTCVCNSGYEKFNKRCVAKCGTNEVRNASGTCVCVDGYEKVGGVCKPKCGTNQVRNSSGACTCASGYEPVNNICKPKCGANQTRNSSGDCTCASGYEVYGGKCVTVCPSGQTRGSDGVCKSQGQQIGDLKQYKTWTFDAWCGYDDSLDYSECPEWRETTTAIENYIAPEKYSYGEITILGKKFRFNNKATLGWYSDNTISILGRTVYIDIDTYEKGIVTVTYDCPEGFGKKVVGYNQYGPIWTGIEPDHPANGYATSIVFY